MNINATLLVQIVNFCIAYFLFHFILLRPGYQALCEQEADQNALQAKVSESKQAIEPGRQQQKNAWATFRNDCKHYLPSAIDRISIFRGISTSIVPEQLSDAQKKNARTQLANVMLSSFKERY